MPLLPPLAFTDPGYQLLLNFGRLSYRLQIINFLTLTHMPKILVIDDDPDVRMLMKVLMKKQGYEVETAYNKEDALIKLQDFQPSVILLDVLLSGTDGRELCKQIKETVNLQAVPVIMISAHPGAAENFTSYGADDFISKPINSDNLLKKVDRLVNVPK